LNRKHIEDEIGHGNTIICDRYTYSGMVYSAAKLNSFLGMQWAREPDVGLPRPDLVIFLDLTPEEAMKRGGYGDEAYEKRDFQEIVREFFLCLAKAGREECEDMVVINAGGSVEDVSQKIYESVYAKLAAVESAEIGKEIRRIKKWPDDDSISTIRQLEAQLKTSRGHK
jgi:dTMP kinase